MKRMLSVFLAGFLALAPVVAEAAYVASRADGVSLRQFKAKCDGVTDDTNAITLAAAQNVPLLVPVGGCLLSASVTFTKPVYFLPGAYFQWKTDLGSGVAGMICDGGSGQTGTGCTSVKNATLIGPGCSAIGVCNFTLGTAPAQMYGLEIGAAAATAPQPTISGMSAQGFYAAEVINSNYGHVKNENNVFTNNYYGLYVLHLGGDLSDIYNSISGQTMAGIALAATVDGIDSSKSVGDHIGNAPFGIYQEPGATGASGFLTSSAFWETHFESIGNCFICSRAAPGSGGNPNLGPLELMHPGASWSSNYQLGAGSNPGQGVTTTGTTTNASKTLTALGTTSGIMVGMQATDADSDLPFAEYVVAVGPNASLGLSAGQVLLTQAATGSHTAENITFQWEQSYAINAGAGSINGRIHVVQGEAPITPGNTGTILYAAQGANGFFSLDYDDPNTGAPGSSTNLADSADGDLSKVGSIRQIGYTTMLKVTVNSGQSSGQASTYWQGWMTGKKGYTVDDSDNLLCMPLSDPGQRWSAAGEIIGTQLTVTVTLAGNASANTVFNCQPWANQY